MNRGPNALEPGTAIATFFFRRLSHCATTARALATQVSSRFRLQAGVESLIFDVVEGSRRPVAFSSLSGVGDYSEVCGFMLALAQIECPQTASSRHIREPYS